MYPDQVFLTVLHYHQSCHCSPGLWPARQGNRYGRSRAPRDAATSQSIVSIGISVQFSSQPARASVRPPDTTRHTIPSAVFHPRTNRFVTAIVLHPGNYLPRAAIAPQYVVWLRTFAGYQPMDLREEINRRTPPGLQRRKEKCYSQTHNHTSTRRYK